MSRASLNLGHTFWGARPNSKMLGTETKCNVLPKVYNQVDQKYNAISSLNLDQNAMQMYLPKV